MKLWQKIGLAAAGVLGVSYVVGRIENGAGSPAATPHGGTVGPNGTTLTPSNSGTSSTGIVGTIGTAALSAATFLGVQKGIGLLTGGSSTATDDASSTDATAATDTVEAENAATDTNLATDATTTTTEATTSVTEAAATTTAESGGGLLGELEAAVVPEAEALLPELGTAAEVGAMAL